MQSQVGNQFKKKKKNNKNKVILEDWKKCKSAFSYLGQVDYLYKCTL